MTMKNKIYLIACCIVAICGIFLFRNVDWAKNSGQSDDESMVVRKEGQPTDEAGITRAVAAKMMSLLVNTHGEIEGRERVIPYVDVNEEKWYDKYVNNLYHLGVDWNTGKVDEFGPLDHVTYAQCKAMLQAVRGAEYVAGFGEGAPFSIQGKNDGDVVQLEEWMALYRVLVAEQTEMAQAGGNITEADVVREMDLYVLDLVEREDGGVAGGSKEESTMVSLWKAITDKGEYYFDGFALDGVVDAAIHAFVKGEDVVYVDGVVEGEVVLSNAWILSGEGKEVRAFLNGTAKTFTVQNELSEPVSKVVGDIAVHNRAIVRISVKPERINGKVLEMQRDAVELEEYGTLPLDENYKIYSVWDEVASEVPNGVLVGYQATDFVVADGKVQAALITSEPATERIRVAIKTTGFKDYYHGKVKLTANTAFTVKFGKNNKEYEAGKAITIKPNGKFMKAGRMKVETVGGQGKIQLLTVNRNGNAPSYRGSFEVKQTDKGLLAINELSLEEYLYAVIPSEMPTNYGVEALKVQAVCARSYAYMQVVTNGLMHLGAHVDDSANYQVYNNTPEDESSVRAVDETRGRVLQYKGEVATAYYFSTSCGHTAGANDVWISNAKVPYLTAKLQVEEGTDVGFEADLSKEENFRNFIANNPTPTFDEQFAWYRWRTTVPSGHLRNSIDAALRSRYQANPALIQTQREDGSFRSVPVETIGDLVDIKVEERKAGGVITSILLMGSERNVRVRSEYNIRLVLAPRQDVIERKDGSKINGFGMMPSAFFYVDSVEGGFQFTGGGYGHGVGMSQNGVKAMTDGGKTFEEVLEHYYKGAEVVVPNGT